MIMMPLILIFYERKKLISTHVTRLNFVSTYGKNKEEKSENVEFTFKKKVTC